MTTFPVVLLMASDDIHIQGLTADAGMPGCADPRGQLGRLGPAAWGPRGQVDQMVPHLLSTQVDIPGEKSLRLCANYQRYYSGEEMF